MRKLLLALFLLATYASHAQLATFDTLTLAKADTFYVNYNNPLSDQGFDDHSIHFPYVWDTSFGGSWSAGFAYSSKRDSVTSGWSNQYAAKAHTGYNGSDKYSVYWTGYGDPRCIRTSDKHAFKPVGVYVTNSTYAYNSMRDGDFVGKKFGGATGHDSDWFYVGVHAYKNGVVIADSLQFFLADFRSSDNSKDYIVSSWKFWDLSALPMVDSIFFTMNSSDVGAFGINTPTYFCLDNLELTVPAGIGNQKTSVAKVYPNPATDRLFVELNDQSIRSVRVFDATGRLLMQQENSGNRLQFDLNNLTPGVYFLRMEGAAGEAVQQFIKH
jgi:hypothetical protein